MKVAAHESLARAFCETAGRPDAIDDDLEAPLASMVHEATAAWPGLKVPAERFVRYVAERVPPTADARDALGRLHARGLYIACACLDGDPVALALIDSEFLAHIRQVLGRMADTHGFADEVKQQVRVKLFVAERGQEPKIAEYRGAGDLRTFLRVLVMRQAISLRRKNWREVRFETGKEPAPDAWAASDPEILHLREKYAGEFQSAFHDAIQALPSEDRNLLRYHYLDGLTIDHIGAIYGIHRVTASRRLIKIRGAMVAATRALLATRLRLHTGEIESVLRLLESDIDLSLRGAFERASGESRADGVGA